MLRCGCVTLHLGRSWGQGGNVPCTDIRGHCITPCSLSQLKLEDRSVVPRDVVRHMRSTVSVGAGVAWGVSGLGLPWRLVLCVCSGLDAFSSPGQPVRHRDRRQHRLCRQAHRHQLHHLPRQQQGPPAHLGERPRPLGCLLVPCPQAHGTFPGADSLCGSRAHVRSGRIPASPACIAARVCAPSLPSFCNTLLLKNKFLP